MSRDESGVQMIGPALIPRPSWARPVDLPPPPWSGPRSVAQLPNGEVVYALGNGTTGVCARAVVGIPADQSVYVRSHRWSRYVVLSDGRTRLTGEGRAREL